MSHSMPLVVDIARGRTTDGPGIRSVVFFKGCPLRCTYCHNPETHHTEREIAWHAGQCVACGEGAQVCPVGAIEVGQDGRCQTLDRSRCDACGRCAERCAGRALRAVGVAYRPDDLVEILLRDRAFYRHSGGGVTLSGGECTLHPEYLHRVLQRLRQHAVHVVLQTCGWFDYDEVRRLVLPLVDEVYFDLKPIDADLHRAVTGRSNGRIHANLARLIADNEVVVRPRMVMVPDLTTTDENLRAAVALLCRLGASDLTLLPYAPFGGEMHVALGRRGSERPGSFLSPEQELALRARVATLLDEHWRSTPAASPEESVVARSMASSLCSTTR